MTTRIRLFGTAVGIALAAAGALVQAQIGPLAQDPLAPVENKTPNVIAVAGDVATTLGSTVFINHGIVGIGRIAADTKDTLNPVETFGSASSLQITNWTKVPDGYSGTFQILPDRGYNSGNFFADYAARIYSVGFHFTPYTGSAPIGGADIFGMMAAQSQIGFTTPIIGVKFTYTDPIRGVGTLTTGLDPGTGFNTIFGKSVPYVFSYTGAAAPGGPDQAFNGVNKLPIDAEALVLKADGSGYVGDEYGADIYYFNSAKQIIGVIVTPPAFQPHTPTGTLNFNSLNAPTNGRRNNQGLEGVSLSPDGTLLFALLQSSTIQDSNSSNQNRKHTRLLVYDVSNPANPTPTSPIAEYALTLPVFRQSGKNNPVDSTAAQSEIVAIDNNRLLVLSRDGNGLGNSGNNQSVFKSVLLVDLRVSSPTNFANNVDTDKENGKITSSPGVLLNSITPLTWTEAVNMLNQTQLNKFNEQLYAGDTAQITQLTLGEKWEGLSLMPALDPSAPDDYFLFVANDNDFLTSSGQMQGPGGLIAYDGFSGYDPLRQPINGPTGSKNANDTMFFVFRVTLTQAPQVARSGFVRDRRTGAIAQEITLQNVSMTEMSGPIDLALDNLTPGVTLVNRDGTTAKLGPLGSPYRNVVPAGVTLAPGGSVKFQLLFNNPGLVSISYDARPLVHTATPAP